MVPTTKSTGNFHALVLTHACRTKKLAETSQFFSIKKEAIEERNLLSNNNENKEIEFIDTSNLKENWSLNRISKINIEEIQETNINEFI